MSLYIEYQLVNGPEEAYEIVKKHLTPELVAKFKVKADFKYDPQKPQIAAAGKGFKLTLNFLEDKAEVDLDVSFLFMAVKSTVLAKIEKMLQSVL